MYEAIKWGEKGACVKSFAPFGHTAPFMWKDIVIIGLPEPQIRQLNF